MSLTNEMAILNEKELRQITGYTTAARQLEVLHKRGFIRAYRSRDGRVVLERPHYLAVCRGEFLGEHVNKSISSVNVAFLKKA